MRRWRRARDPLPLPFPRLDGSTWPRRGGTSFAASTLYSLAQQEAFTAEVHDVADVVLGEVLPMLDTGAAPEDEAHMRQVCSAATQSGAGIGLVEARTAEAEDAMSPDIAAVLWLAADDLPSMPAQQTQVARYLLLCGYYLARQGRDQVFEVTEALWQEDHPAVRPGPGPGVDD
jgi:hypothetical protein